jgi:hypothetical protein
MNYPTYKFNNKRGSYNITTIDEAFERYSPEAPEIKVNAELPIRVAYMGEISLAHEASRYAHYLSSKAVKLGSKCVREAGKIAEDVIVSLDEARGLQ